MMGVSARALGSSRTLQVPNDSWRRGYIQTGPSELEARVSRDTRLVKRNGRLTPRIQDMDGCCFTGGVTFAWPGGWHWRSDYYRRGHGFLHVARAPRADMHPADVDILRRRELRVNWNGSAV